MGKIKIQLDKRGLTGFFDECGSGRPCRVPDQRSTKDSFADYFYEFPFSRY